MRKLSYIIVILTTVFAGIAQSRIITDEDGNRMLEMPSPPDSLKSPEDRASYIAERFWETMDFTDSALVNDCKFMEQQFANYVFMLSLANDSSRTKAVTACMKKAKLASANAYDNLLAMADEYLSQPWSPNYSDELYIPFMQFAASQDDQYAIMAKSRYADLLKNRTGTAPADFAFTTREGKKKRLNDMLGRNTETLLIFYDPTCEDCHDLIRKIASDQSLCRKINNGELSIIMIYAGDDADLWKRDAMTIPPGWTVGIAPSSMIDEEELYVIPFTPSTYLISSEGKIKYKNMPVERLLNSLI